MPEPSAAALLACLRQGGAHSLAYATLQPGLQYLLRPGLGYLAYAQLGARRQAVLGDPVAPREAWPGLLAALQHELPRACFVQVTEPCACLLAAAGYHVNRMGEEVVLPLARWSLAGRRTQNLRTVRNRAGRLGLIIAELTSWSTGVAADLAAVNGAWLRRHAPGERELRLVLRPAALAPEPDVRVWTARGPDGRLLAFTCFDPLYERGRITGYAANILRAADPAAEQWRDVLICAAVAQFQREGVGVLNLGIAPFLQLDTPVAFHPSWFTRACFWASPRWLGWLYNYRGIARHKAQYGGDAQPVYFATRESYPLGTLLRLLAASGIHPARRLCWRQRSQSVNAR